MRVLELLNLETGAPISALIRIIANAPKRYKEYDIPKRSGGSRRIAHPAKELKVLQRAVLKEFLEPCPVSEVATAYVKDRGILYNAKEHVGQRWILKLDFSNFFHSLKPIDWDRAVLRIPELNHLKADKEILHRLLFWGQGSPDPKCLSIGAPTSPLVSNLICHKLDEWLSGAAGERGLKVTRYADDITVSGSNVPQLTRFESDLKRTLKGNRGLNLTFNDQKRGLYGPGQRKLVTGLVLTPDGRISIGRERKREIQALVHRYSLGQLDLDMTMRAKGLMAFAYSIEKNFFRTIEEKHGEELVKSLMATFQEPDPQYENPDFI